MQDIHDIRPPVPVGIDPWLIKMAGIALALVLAAVLCYLLFCYLKKRQDSKPGDLLLLPLPLPPDEAALKELDAVADLMKTDPRLYYFRLTGILKAYIGKQYKINAPEMTTQEIVSQLTRLEIEKSVSSSARDFFGGSDTIKYAGRFPSLEMMTNDAELVRAFVAATVETTKEPGHER